MKQERPLNILIAEDEYLILMGLKSALEGLGHQIVGEATNGEEAVKLTLEKKPDLIVMDINLPKLDGIEAIKRINKKLLVPSIIVTGYNNKELIDRAREAGVFGYLIKPVNEEELKPEIEIVMARFKEFQRLKNELSETQKALEARKYIERAKGILIDKYDMKEAQAMKALQKKSRNTNKKMITVAKQIIKADNILSMDEEELI